MWVVECPSIPGCVSQGDTKEEALANIREAIELCLEARSEKECRSPIETRQVEVAVAGEKSQSSWTNFWRA